VLSFCTILLQILGVRSFLFSELLLFYKRFWKGINHKRRQKKRFFAKILNITYER
jgi:hypothetical protein